MRLLVLVILALSILRVHAADENLDTLAQPPEPVKYYKAPLPAAAVDAQGSAIPEPEVTITTKGETLHEEYRIGGQLYMIKVIPKNGRPYYLIDNEGQGQFVRNDFQPSISPPQWVIKRF